MNTFFFFIDWHTLKIVPCHLMYLPIVDSLGYPEETADLRGCIIFFVYDTLYALRFCFPEHALFEALQFAFFHPTRQECTDFAALPVTEAYRLSKISSAKEKTIKFFK